MSETLSMHETAEFVGVSYEHFRKEWRTWRGEVNFPSPMPGLQRRRRWSREALRDWLASASRPKPGRPPARTDQGDPWTQLERLRALQPAD